MASLPVCCCFVQLFRSRHSAVSMRSSLRSMWESPSTTPSPSPMPCRHPDRFRRLLLLRRRVVFACVGVAGGVDVGVCVCQCPGVSVCLRSPPAWANKGHGGPVCVRVPPMFLYVGFRLFGSARGNQPEENQSNYRESIATIATIAAFPHRSGAMSQQERREVATIGRHANGKLRFDRLQSATIAM